MPTVRVPARRLSLVTLLGLAAALLAVPSAVAGERAALPITEAVHLLVDESRGHLVVAQGRGSAELLVTDLAGTSAAAVRLANAVHVELDEARGWYWVSQAEQHTLTAVDAESLEVVRTYDARIDPEDEYSCPDTSVVVETLVAFSSGCDGTLAGQFIRLLDPETGAVTRDGYAPAAGLVGPPDGTAAGTALARSLWTWDYYEGLIRYEVDPATRSVVRAAVQEMRQAEGLAVTPDGETLVGTRGGRWDALTLTPLAPFDLPPRYGERFIGVDVGVTPDGRTVFTTTDFAPVEPVLTVPAGSLQVGRTYDLRGDLRDGADSWRLPLVMALGAVDIYVISQGRDGLRLDVLSPGPDATLTLTEPAKAYPYGARVRLPVKLDARSTDRTVQIWTAGIAAGYLSQPDLTLDPAGFGRVPVRLTKSITVLVGYDAVETSESVRDSQLLMVSPRLTVTLPGSGGGGVPAYPAGKSATIAVAVKGRPECVRILIERRVEGIWRSVARSACDSPRAGEVATVLPWRPDLRGAELRASVESRADRYWAAATTAPRRFTFR